MYKKPTISNNDGITIGHLIAEGKVWFNYLIRRWWIFLLAGAVGGGLGVLYATYQQPRFQSKLTFALEDNGGGLNGALNLAAEFGLSIGGSSKDIFAGENIVAILTSRRMIEGVLLSVDTQGNKAQTMAEYYLQISNLKKAFTNHPRLGTINFPVNMPRDKFSYHQDSVLYVLYQQISKNSLVASKPDRKLNLYEILMVSPDERFSKLFTERILKQAIDFYIELRTSRSKQTLSVLEGRVASMRGSAKSALQNRAGIQDANLNPAFAAQSAQLQQTQLDVSAFGGAYAELFKNLEMARYQYLQDIPLLQIIDAPQYPMKNLKKGRLLTGIVFAFATCFVVLMWLFLAGLAKGVHRSKD